MAKIIFFGTPDYVVCVPQDLKDAGHEIVAVVTPQPKPQGREKIIAPSPVAVWAQNNNIPVIHNLNDLVSMIRINRTELGIVASYRKIIPKEVLDFFPKGILNIHPSLLPKYRGASPIPAAILAGDKETGVTLIKMDEQIDHGPIIAQKPLPIPKEATTKDMLPVAFKKGAEVLINILPDYLKGALQPIEQQHTKATYTWKTSETKEKAYFDIKRPPSQEVIDRMAKAFYPWPSAWTIWPFDSAQGKKAKIVKFFPNKKIQIEGKRPVTYKQFKEGYPDFPLELT